MWALKSKMCPWRYKNNISSGSVWNSHWEMVSEGTKMAKVQVKHALGHMWTGLAPTGFHILPSDTLLIRPLTPKLYGV